MEPQIQKKLSVALQNLETTYKELLLTQGFNKEVERIKILSELIKEQIPNENSHITAG